MLSGRGIQKSHGRDLRDLKSWQIRRLRGLSQIALDQPSFGSVRALPLLGGCTGSWQWEDDSNSRCSRFWWLALSKASQIYTVSRPFDPCRAWYSSWKLDREELLERAAQSHLASSRNDAFRSFHWLPSAFSDRSVYSWWWKWHQPEVAQGTSGSYSYASRAESLKVAVAAGILMFSLRKFEKKEVYLTCKKSWWRSYWESLSTKGGYSLYHRQRIHDHVGHLIHILRFKISRHSPPYSVQSFGAFHSC